jgi:hypothetical protein
LDKEVNVVKLNKVEGEEDPFGVIIDLGENKGKKQIYFEKPEIPSSNAIKKELEEFADAIQNDLTPTVSINDGFNALDIAFKIIDKLKLSSNMLES